MKYFDILFRLFGLGLFSSCIAGAGALPGEPGGQGTSHQARNRNPGDSPDAPLLDSRFPQACFHR